MNLVFLRPEEVETVWSEVAPQFERVIGRAIHGEFTIQDLYRLAREGKITVGVAKEGGEVVMALAFEFVFYPSATAVNVLAMAGRRLEAFMHRFLPPFVAFCRKAGADWIECRVSPAMERMHRRYGFATVYRCLRMNVKEEAC